MDRTLLINGLTFLLIDLFIYWRLTDPRSKEEKIKYYFSKTGILIGLFAFAYLVLNYLSGMYFPLPYSGFDELLTLAGLWIFLIGAGIAIWAKITMGKYWNPPVSHDHKRQNKLMKTGPFKYSRNPIYVGMIMVLAGYGIALQSYFTFLTIIPIYYFYNSVLKEEKNLEKVFKEEYLKYKKEVPRFF